MIFGEYVIEAVAFEYIHVGLHESIMFEYVIPKFNSSPRLQMMTDPFTSSVSYLLSVTVEPAASVYC